MAGKFLESLTFESINSCATNKRNESLIKCRVAPISPKPIRRHHKVSRFLRASLSFLSSHTHSLFIIRMDDPSWSFIGHGSDPAFFYQSKRADL